MSTHYIKLIPTDPDFMPDPKVQEQCRRWLVQRFPNEDLVLEAKSSLVFVDQGEEPEQITCNKCGKAIDLDYWQDLMEKAHAAQFESLVFETSCCNTITSLNELHYPGPAGFARFVIAWKKPGKQPSDSDMAACEKILGTPLKKIEGYY